MARSPKDSGVPASDALWPTHFNVHKAQVTIENYLLGPEKRRRDSEVTRINRLNNSIIGAEGGTLGRGFIINGRKFTDKDAPINTWDHKTIHIDLMDEGIKFLAYMMLVEEDIQMIKQQLYQLLARSQGLQDIRDNLPECLRDVFPPVSILSRKRDEAFSIQGDERLMRQYNLVNDRINFYSAMNVLF